jgi:hypothetical protein
MYTNLIHSSQSVLSFPVRKETIDFKYCILHSLRATGTQHTVISHSVQSGDIHDWTVHQTWREFIIRNVWMFRILTIILLYNFNITLTFIAKTTHWCSNGVLSLYDTIYNLTKLFSKAAYVLSFSVHWCSLKTAINNSRNILECFSIHGHVQLFGNKLIYGYNRRSLWELHKPQRTHNVQTNVTTNAT